MAKRRRFERIISSLFLGLGATLLLIGGFIWAVPAAPPPTVRQARLLPQAQVDPVAALRPAPPGAPVDQLLPQSPSLPQPPRTGNTAVQTEPVTAEEGQAADLPTGAAAAQPLRILIPALGIDAPVEAVALRTGQDAGHDYGQWPVPDAFAAGWHETSAPIGRPGNTVLNGHNNVHGAIFAGLVDLAQGEQIILMGAGTAQVYRVAHHELVEEDWPSAAGAAAQCALDRGDRG